MLDIVDVVMATLNGEKYIADQLESIINQDYTNWHLWIQDDGSTDNTLKIIQKYKDKHSNKITLVKDNPHIKGAATNFLSMLPLTKGKYVFFCDQDDVWDSDKISKTIKRFKEEEKYGLKPILVHSDLRVVNEELSVINKSFMKYQGLRKNALTLKKILCQNNVTGCTMAINRRLLEKMKLSFVPPNLLMHDWWLAIGAAAFGKICFIEESLVAYRQHDKNQVGAKENKIFDNIMKSFKNASKFRKSISSTYWQAEDFYQAYNHILSVERKKDIKFYANLNEADKWKRVKSILFKGYRKHGFFRIIGQVVFG